MDDDAPVVAPVFTKRRRIPLADAALAASADEAASGGSVVFRPRRPAQLQARPVALVDAGDAGQVVRRPARPGPMATGVSTGAGTGAGMGAGTGAGSRSISTQTATKFIKRKIARPLDLSRDRDRERDFESDADVDDDDDEDGRRGAGASTDKGGSYSVDQLARLRANTADLSTRPEPRARQVSPRPLPADERRLVEEQVKASATATAAAAAEVEARAAAAKIKWARQAVWDLPASGADDEADNHDDRASDGDYISLNAKGTADKHAGLGYAAPAVYDDILDYGGNDNGQDNDNDGVMQVDGEYGDGRLPVGDAARAASDRRRRAEMADLLRTAQLSDTGSDSDTGGGGRGGKAAAGEADDDDISENTSDDDWEQTQLDRMTGVRRTTTRRSNVDDYDDGGALEEQRSAKHSLAAQRAARGERKELERPIPTLSDAIDAAERAVAAIVLAAAPQRQRREALLERKAEIERQKAALQRDIADADRQALEVLRAYAPQVYDELVQSGRYKAA